MPPLTVASHRVIADRESFQPSQFARVAAFVVGASVALVAVALTVWSMRAQL